MGTTSIILRNISLFDGLSALPEKMALRIDDGVISGLWPESTYKPPIQEKIRELEGGFVTPGIIDCHTHLVFAGNRAHEFERRLNGESYADIARSGGGIISTVQATRAASEDDLIAQSLPRLDALIADGVTTVEIKSGYGLNIETELKMLRVAKRLEKLRPIRVMTTLLGAHAVPPEFSGRSDDYVTSICEEMIPAAAQERLADSVDVFCENIAFTPSQCERVFIAAKKNGLSIKAHTEQLSNLGGSALAATHGALSVDHIEYLDEAGILAMAQSGSVAVLLPGAFYFLRETRVPPIELLRKHHVPIALASDANPGSSPIFSMNVIANMGCVLFGLTPLEVLRAVTHNAAKALGLKELGHIKIGAPADLCIWNMDGVSDFAYAIQPFRLRHRIFKGKIS